ncbi:hypothetical protein ACO1PF_00670 [Alkalibacterium sp. f15]|uniref:hypothetical protein n=1 Tax=Alkalibacterium sp. f15 TaxID=3414029 RepID=UPI003BF82612
MFIVDMTTYESDFVLKSTKKTGAYQIRTFDIDHAFSLFAFYYEGYVHLKLRRYKDEETTYKDWERIKTFGTLYPDICLTDAMDVYLDTKENQLHVQIPYPIYKRSDN